MRPSAGRAAPFLVKCREQNDDSTEQRDQHVNELLAEYAYVFDAPTVGTAGNNTPEGIRLQPDASPPNRPPFRLSMKERKVVEVQVQELLDSKRIVPSTSTRAVPVQPPRSSTAGHSYIPQRILRGYSY